MTAPASRAEPGTERRVVSLVPAATEILRHLGVEPVGISHSCENLDTGAPVLTSSIVPEGLSQGEIDRFVSAASAAGESLYRVDELLLDRLKPDVIVTQGVCEVCAVGPGEVARAVTTIPRPLPTVLLEGTRLDQLYSDMAKVGAAIGRDVADDVADLRACVDAVRAAVAGRPRPRVAVVEWLDPPFLAGHWVPDMIEAAGGIPIGPAAGVPSPRATWDEIAAEKPDIVLFAFCGYGLEAAVTEIAASTLPLPEGAKLVALDARYFCALTPRVVRGVEILAGLIHPDICPEPEDDEAAPIERGEA